MTQTQRRTYPERIPADLVFDDAFGRRQHRGRLVVRNGRSRIACAQAAGRRAADRVRRRQEGLVSCKSAMRYDPHFPHEGATR